MRLEPDMRREPRILAFLRDSIRWAGSVPRPTKLMAPALLAISLACSGGTPTREDLAEITREAAKAESASDSTGSPARQAVRDTVRQVVGACHRYEADIVKHFWRSELRTYLFLDDSYVGGTFPKGIAELLRQVQALEDSYLADIRGFPETLATHLEKREVPEEERPALEEEMAGAFAEERKPIVTAVETHRKLIEAAAELNELVASRPESLKAYREGLEISDLGLLESFNSQVDAVNEARKASDAAFQALDAEQQKGLYWLGLVTNNPRHAKRERDRMFGRSP